MILTDIQFSRAWSLALNHGHRWAVELAGRAGTGPPSLPAPAKRWSTELIRSLVIAGEPEGDLERQSYRWGIYAPEKDTCGAVVHQTLTGRVRWKIEKSGIVNVTIHRPEFEKPVLAATIDPAGAIGLAGPGHWEWNDAPFHVRHVAALARCLEAVCETSDVETALASPRKALNYSDPAPSVLECALPDEAPECASPGQQFVEVDENGKIVYADRHPLMPA